VPAHRPTDGRPPDITDRQEANKHSSSKATDQSETLFASPSNHRAVYAGRPWCSAHNPLAPPDSSPPKPIHLWFAVPADAWVVARHCILHNITLIRTADIKDLIKVQYDKPVQDVIHWLLRHRVLARDRKRGHYTCNLERALYVTGLPPYPIGKRHYANLEAKLQLPEWQDVQKALCEWIGVIQGTRGSCPVIKPSGTPSGTSPPSLPPQTSQAQPPAGYPRPLSGLTLIRLRVPSGHCLSAVATHYLDGTPMYVFLHGLIRRGSAYPRQDLYCARLNGALYCFARKDLLRRYMSAPCPYCAPVVPYPVPCEGQVPASEPVIDNLRANGGQSIGLVPYSQAPDRFSYGEPGVHYRPDSDTYSFLAGHVIYIGYGAVMLQPTARSILHDWQAILYHFDALATALLHHVTMALVQSAEFGKHFLGLTTPKLIDQVMALADRVLEATQGKADSNTFVPYLRDVAIDVYERVKVQTKGTVIRERYQWVKTDTLTFKKITVIELYNLVVLRQSQGQYLIPQDFVLVLPLPLYAFVGLKYIRKVYHSLKAMLIKVYHNDRKDRPGTVRVEGVPLKGTVQGLNKRELFVLFFAQLHVLGFLLDRDGARLVKRWLGKLEQARARKRAQGQARQ